MSVLTDHPRSRGVYVTLTDDFRREQGSSPLARGLPLVSELPARAIGIIPARAGFTQHSHTPLVASADHPRSRGVYRRPSASSSARAGSSPLARGLRTDQPDRMRLAGIIPARAGFTPAWEAWQSRGRDHPRSRGVYGRSSRTPTWCSGSSPLARGLHRRAARAQPLHRIIPARAGFTPGRQPLPGRPADHPRSRGVYRTRPGRTPTYSGSSPLARGLPRTVLRPATYMRIIPARAGFTLRRGGQWQEHEDHPRSRGVYARGLAGTGLLPGSSPLARGLLIPPDERGAARGIIPARAGFTLADPWNPNEPTLYQTPAAFTADLGPAPPGRDSAVEFGAALSTAGRAGRNLAAAGLRPRFGHHPDRHRRVATTSG